MLVTADYLLIGHATADIKRYGRTLGGTVSYAAPVVKQFGHRVAVLTSAAACEPLLADLLYHAAVTVKIAEETTTFENLYDEHGHRTQYVHETAATLTYDDIPVSWVSAPMVHLAPLVAEVPPDIVHRFEDSTLMLTPQGWLREWDENGRVSFKRWFDAGVLKAIDIVVFSKEDIAAAPELEAEFAGVVKHLFVTDGERGGTYYYRGQPQPYMPTRVQEMNPTGAGDVFAAALLSSLFRLNHNMNAAIDVAARLAALSVTREGSQNVLTVDEVEQAISDAREAWEDQ